MDMKKKTITLGQWIVAKRKELGLSQTELANKIEVSYPPISRYEIKDALPQAETLKKLADVLDKTVDFLFNGATEEKAKATLKDTELLCQFKEIEQLPENSKKTILEVIERFVRSCKTVLLIPQNKIIMFCRIFFFLLLTCLPFIGVTQTESKIDSSNYYDFYSDGTGLGGLTTDWLRESEVVPIIHEILKNANYEWISDYCLFKLPSEQRIVLSIYCRKSNFGVLYIQGHALTPKKEHRKINQSSLNYTFVEYDSKGEPTYFKITEVPKNIFLLSENCYWYQYADNGSSKQTLVTKEIAINILKQDIMAILSMAPKP